MMTEIERNIFKRVGVVLRLGHQCVDQVSQITLVLGLGLEHFAAHFYQFRLGVVAGPYQLDELDALVFRQTGQVPDAKFKNNFLLGRMRFAHVSGIAEAERMVERWRREWLGEF